MFMRVFCLAWAVSLLVLGCSGENVSAPEPDAPAVPAATTPAEPTPAPEANAGPAQPATETPAPDAATAEAPKPDLSRYALKIDPICGMNLETTPVSDEFEYQGKTYGFCSNFCKKSFAEDPEKALTRIGHPNGE